MIRALVLALLCSCSPPASSDIVLDVASGFTATERAAILSAADRWNRVTRPDLKIHVSRTATNTRIEPRRLQWSIDGTYNGRIEIQVELSDDRFLTVATHEMGHALGLAHVPHGLMDPSASESAFTPEDLAECRRVRSCE